MNPNDIAEIADLTAMQGGLLVRSMSHDEANTYVRQLTVNLTCVIEEEAMRCSLIEVARRHSACRTAIVCENVKVPRQVILKDRTIELNFHRIDVDEGRAFDRVLVEYQEKDYQRGFDLKKDSLIRMTLLQRRDDQCSLLLSYHHIIFDGWSVSLILNECFGWWHHFAKGSEAPCFQPAAQFVDYVDWTSRLDPNQCKEFWNEILRGFEGKTRAPGFSEATAVCRTPQTEHYVQELGGAESELLDRFARNHGVTVSTVCHLVWGLLLRIYNCADDVVFGRVPSTRPATIHGIENAVGLMVNTVPCRVNFASNRTLLEIAKDLQEQMFSSEPFNAYSLSEIVKGSESEQMPFDHIVAYENYPRNASIENADVVKNVSARLETEYDLTVIIAWKETLVIDFFYQCPAIERSAMERLAEQMIHVIRQWIHDPSLQVSGLSWIPESERSLLDDGIQCREVNTTIAELFQSVAARTPNAIALTGTGPNMSYADLDRASDVWAGYLIRTLGQGRGRCIGVFLEQSSEYVISLLAILKAGYAYVPIDTDYPKERIEFMLRDCDVCCVFTSLLHQSQLPAGIKSICLDESLERCSEGDRLDVESSPENLAYVMYTSGTTGNPKGVSIAQKAIVHLVNNCHFESKVPIQVVFQTGAVCFDASTFEIWYALLNGLELSIIKKAELVDPKAFRKRLAIENGSLIFLTTGLFHAYCKNDPSFFKETSVVLVGGDTLSAQRVKEAMAENVDTRFYNCYGPTEATAFACIHPVTPGDFQRIPIGKHLAHFAAYVLGDGDVPVPIGALGELCLAGESLAQGYRNAPELTAEKFFVHSNLGGVRLYRTGDLCRMQRDGVLQYVGRKDCQVKVNGHRVEPAEIENCLKAHSGISDVVVIARKREGGNDSLHAYYSAKEEIKKAVLVQHLGERLPKFMCPSRFVFMPFLPLNSNGKVDRKKLLAWPDGRVPEETNTLVLDKHEAHDDSQRSEQETVLIELLEEILNVTPISKADDYFTLGGDSIKGILLVTRLRNLGYDLEIKEIFGNSRIEDLATCIEKKQLEISQEPVKGISKLSPIQHWFFQEHATDGESWNQYLLIEFRKSLDVDKVREAWRILWKHHDTLRLHLSREKNELIYSEPDDQSGCVFEVFRRPSPVGCQIGLSDERVELLLKQLSVQRGKMVAVGLFQGDEVDSLFFGIHHLLIDSVSWRILMKDFGQVYEGLVDNDVQPLMPKTHSYQHWSEHMARYAESHLLLKEFAYWKKVCEADTLSLGKVIEWERMKYSATREKTASFGSNLTDDVLRQAHRAYQTRTEDLFVAGLGASLGEWRSKGVYRVDREGHGRVPAHSGIRLDRSLGWFTAIHPFLCEAVDSLDFKQTIIRAKDHLHRIPNHGIGYGVLRYLSNLSPREKAALAVRSDICFNFQGGDDATAAKSEGDSHSVSDYGLWVNPDSAWNYCMNVVVVRKGDQFLLKVRYLKDCFEEKDIDRFMGIYTAMLTQVVEHCLEQNKTTRTVSDYDDDELEDGELARIQTLVGSHG